MAGLFATEGLVSGYARWRPPVHREIVTRIGRRLAGRVGWALDAGCGAGLSTAPLRDIARHVLGVEINSAMLNAAPAVAPGAHFAAAKAEALPVRSDSIDLITAAGSLNYVDLDALFAEVLRVLAPGGLLAVYDFAAGRRFAGSSALESWFEDFSARYPRAQDGARALNPAALARLARGMSLSWSETFEVRLPLDVEFYVEYVMTETNVAWAIQNGASRAEVKSWCTRTLLPVFGGSVRDVLFDAYIACLSPLR